MSKRLTKGVKGIFRGRKYATKLLSKHTIVNIKIIITVFYVYKKQSRL